MPPSKEHSWAEKFQEVLKNRMRMNNDALLRNEIPWVMDFIRQTLREQLTEILAEIEAERGKYIAVQEAASASYLSGKENGLYQATQILTTRLSSLDSNQKEV